MWYLQTDVLLRLFIACGAMILISGLSRLIFKKDFVAACHSDCMLYTYNIYFCTNTETAEKNTAVFLRTVQYFVYSAVFLRTNDGVFPATSCNNYICGNSVSYAKSG